MTDERKPKRRIGAKLLLASITTLAALAAGELLVRGLGLAPRVRRISLTHDDEDSIYRLSENRILGYEIKANYRNDNPDYDFTCASTNSYGQHDVERRAKKPEGVRRVLLLGDSVVESINIRALDDLMNRQLEALYPDGKTEVLNFGVSGYCTLGEVELLKVKGLQFQPDIVIVVFVWNDYENFNSGIIEALQSPSRRPSWLFQQLFLHSELFRLSCLRLNLASSNLPGDPAAWNDSAIGDNNVVKALERLRDMSREHGFQAALAIWPEFQPDRIVDRCTMPDSEQLVVERIAEMYGIPTFRLSEHFRKHRASIQPPPDPNTYYTVGDTMHPNEQGAKVAAEALREIIESLPEPGAATDAAGRAPDPRAVELAMQLGDHPEFDLATAMCRAARAQIHAGDAEQAIAHLEQALEIDPRCYTAAYELAAIYVRRGELDRAEGFLRDGVRANPELAQPHYHLGYLLRLRGKLDEAETEFREALRIDGEFAGAHFGLAAICKSRGRLIEAREHYARGERIEAERQRRGSKSLP